MGMMGMQEILVIVLIVIVVFGSSRLPKMGKALGEGIREFKNVRTEIAAGIKEGKTDDG